jgi:elongation factor G
MRLHQRSSHAIAGRHAHANAKQHTSSADMHALVQVIERPIPDDMADSVADKRHELVECVANADDEVMELYIDEQHVDGNTLQAAVRRATVAREFFPVFMGSAYKNVGVQSLLDGVSSFLPDPTQVPSA